MVDRKEEVLRDLTIGRSERGASITSSLLKDGPRTSMPSQSWEAASLQRYLKG